MTLAELVKILWQIVLILAACCLISGLIASWVKSFIIFPILKKKRISENEETITKLLEKLQECSGGKEKK